jgi:hypothetical protein
MQQDADSESSHQAISTTITYLLPKEEGSYFMMYVFLITSYCPKSVTKDSQMHGQTTTRIHTNQIIKPCTLQEIIVVVIVVGNSGSITITCLFAYSMAQSQKDPSFRENVSLFALYFS